MPAPQQLVKSPPVNKLENRDRERKKAEQKEKTSVPLWHITADMLNKSCLQAYVVTMTLRTLKTL